MKVQFCDKVKIHKIHEYSILLNQSSIVEGGNVYF